MNSMKSFTSLPSLLFCAVTVLQFAGCAQAAAVANTKQSPLQSVIHTPAVTERPGDKYVLPAGAGTKDGSSWANAFDAAGFQAGWDALQPGQTLWVGSGEYSNAQLKIKSGGEAGKLKTIAGKDTGGGAPVFAGTFKKDNPSKSGANFISLSDGADFWSVQDIHVRDYKNGIASSAGGHEGVRIRNFDVTGSREGISLVGGGTPEKPELGSHDVEISDCEFVGYTKRGIRLKGGNYDFRITNCVADAGGKAWATEPFHMGFSVEGPRDHDITYTNCVALNNYHNAGEGYWNADGFCAERVNNLRFINCMAFDNTDGGWDLKAENVILEGCVAVGNKRNYRFWGASTMLIRCLAAESVYPGGTGSALGLWAKGNVTVENSTFYNSSISPDGGTVTVTNSIIARSKSKPGRVPLGEKEGLKLVDTVLWDETTSQGENPQFVNPSPLWDGRGNAFDSKKFNPRKGFYSTFTSTLPFRRTQPMTPGDRSKATDAGTDENDPPKSPEQIALEAAKLPVIENAGFENGSTGWSKMAAPIFLVKTEGASEGGKYMMVTAGANRVEAQGKITSLVEGETYTLSFKSRGSTSKEARIIIRKNAKGSYLASTAPSETAEWTTKTLKFVAPGREALVQISVRSAGTFDLDDFVVKREK
jgi:hypothetical protein